MRVLNLDGWMVVRSAAMRVSRMGVTVAAELALMLADSLVDSLVLHSDEW